MINVCHLSVTAGPTQSQIETCSFVVCLMAPLKLNQVIAIKLTSPCPQVPTS